MNVLATKVSDDIRHDSRFKLKK